MPINIANDRELAQTQIIASLAQQVQAISKPKDLANLAQKNAAVIQNIILASTQGPLGENEQLIISRLFQARGGLGDTNPNDSSVDLAYLFDTYDKAQSGDIAAQNTLTALYYYDAFIGLQQGIVESLSDLGGQAIDFLYSAIHFMLQDRNGPSLMPAQLLDPTAPAPKTAKKAEPIRHQNIDFSRPDEIDQSPIAAATSGTVTSQAKLKEEKTGEDNPKGPLLPQIATTHPTLISSIHETITEIIDDLGSRHPLRNLQPSQVLASLIGKALGPQFRLEAALTIAAAYFPHLTSATQFGQVIETANQIATAVTQAIAETAPEYPAALKLETQDARTALPREMALHSLKLQEAVGTPSGSIDIDLTATDSPSPTGPGITQANPAQYKSSVAEAVAQAFAPPSSTDAAAGAAGATDESRKNLPLDNLSSEIAMLAEEPKDIGLVQV